MHYVQEQHVFPCRLQFESDEAPLIVPRSKKLDTVNSSPNSGDNSANKGDGAATSKQIKLDVSAPQNLVTDRTEQTDGQVVKDMLLLSKVLKHVFYGPQVMKIECIEFDSSLVYHHSHIKTV